MASRLEPRPNPAVGLGQRLDCSTFSFHFLGRCDNSILADTTGRHRSQRRIVGFLHRHFAKDHRRLDTNSGSMMSCRQEELEDRILGHLQRSEIDYLDPLSAELWHLDPE